MGALAALADSGGPGCPAGHASVGRFPACGGLSAVYIWMYRTAGLELTWISRVLVSVAHSFEEIFLVYLTLVCWSWTSGFVLGSASRGIIRLNSILSASCCRSEDSWVHHCIWHFLTSTYIARSLALPTRLQRSGF